MKLLAKQNRELIMINAQNTQNENDAEKIILQVPEQYEDFNKKIVFITEDDGIVWDIIVGNEYLIKKAITKYDKVDFYIWLTKGDVDFRTQTKTLKFYHNEDASEEITPEEISGVNTVVNLLEEEITKVENMNITATKVGTTTTIDITNKEGQTSSVEIEDGTNGTNGTDGVSPTIAETQTENGYDVTITDVNGTSTISLLNGQQGIQGEAGHTPEFGVDYWTPEQQQEIISTATTNTINNYSSTITQIQSNANNALNTANLANTTANTAKSIAEGANQALSYANYQEMVTAFNSLDDDIYRVGQNVMIVTLNVPDLWVSSIESTSASYTYTNDEAITTALSTNGYIQIGYYKLSALETQKVDLTDYYTKTGTENKIEDYLYQIMPTDSTSGAITTIDDATTMFNAVDVTGSIKPVQDLNGQENPYPAGGGKNLFNIEDLIFTSSTFSDGVLSNTASNFASAYTESNPFTVNLTAPVTISLKGKHEGTNSDTRGLTLKVLYSDETTGTAVYFSNGNSSVNYATVTFTSSKDIIGLYFDYGSVGGNVWYIKDFQIEQGSSATDYAPYENICPITGWTGVNIKRTGKNLFNASGMEDSTSWQTDVLTLPSGTYTMSTTKGSLDDTGLYLYFRKTGGSLSSANFVTNTSPVTLTLTSGETAEVVYRKLEGDDSFSNYHYQIELGSTATSYEAYIGETYSIDWTNEAGTVYGGSLDVTTGVLTVDKVLTTITSCLGISTHSSGYKYWVLLNNLNSINTTSSNQNEFLSNMFIGQNGVVPGRFYVTASGSVLICVPYEGQQDITTREQASEWLAENPAQFVYLLAEPITYQLTPQQISFLQGTNNLWVNTGDICVTYKADIQKYIDKKTN